MTPIHNETPVPNEVEINKVGRRTFFQNSGKYLALTVLAIGAGALGLKRFRAWLGEPCIDVTGPCGMCPQVGGCELPKVVAHRRIVKGAKRVDETNGSKPSTNLENKGAQDIK